MMESWLATVQALKLAKITRLWGQHAELKDGGNLLMAVLLNGKPGKGNFYASWYLKKKVFLMSIHLEFTKIK